MRFETSKTVAVPREVTWTVMLDVESLPSLSESVTAVRKLEPGPLRVGMRVRIHQPKLPPATWTVMELVDGERFVWQARGLGFHTVGVHEVHADGDSSRVRLVLDQAGPLGGLVGRLTKGLTERYIELEAVGIKRGAEERAKEAR